VNRFSATKPAAKTLLQAGPWDLLVVQEVGKGRSAVFTSDMTWQWVLKANQPDAHKAFWRNMVTWLTRSDYRDTNKAVFADSDRLHYSTGDEAHFGSHVHETEKSAKDISKARVSALLVKLENGAETVLLKEDF